MKNRKSARRGFSMIELLVVVLILGILLNVAIPSYISTVRSDRGAAANTNAKIMATAVQSAYVLSGEKTYNAAPMTTLGGTVTSDLGGSIPANPCTSTNSIGASPNAWTVSILGGGTGWKISSNDPNAKCTGLSVYQLGN